MSKSEIAGTTQPFAKHFSELSSRLGPLSGQIETAQALFARVLIDAMARGPITVDQYCSYLSMQYHLAKDVQTYFFTIAAHASLGKRRRLRRFLCEFANEEELHYLVAGNDLMAFGRIPCAEPIDVMLWHYYYRSVVASRPFQRLGAAAILENVSGGVARSPSNKALSAPFLSKENTKFLVLHQHETVPHGQQILEALDAEVLSVEELDDLLLGAKRATVLYVRMAAWALNENNLARVADPESDMSALNSRDIERLSTAELGIEK